MAAESDEVSSVPVVSLYESDLVYAGTTFRGVSVADDSYSGFSLCHYVGDEASHWQQCRAELASWLGISEHNIIVPRQTHSARVAFIDDVPVDDRDIDGVDAVVTTLHGVAVGVNTADCLPLLLCDEKVGVVCAVHAGWRGAVGGVVGNALDRMVLAGASPGDIHGFIAPHIGVCCFEVGEEVACQFHPDDVVYHQDGEKPHVNLSGAVTRILVSKGVPRENITDIGECTRCRSDRYFSARARGVASGRNFSFIIKNKIDDSQNRQS